MTPLEKRIGYKFRNSLLLAEAMTHSSLRRETRDGHFDNQRLEFLGDAVLGLVFTEVLYERFPNAAEGELTKFRSRLVSRAGLARIAERIDLGKYVLMGRGEEASGGRERSSIMADAFESLVAAIYLDGQLDAVRKLVLGEAGGFIEECAGAETAHNPKGCLQEVLQALGEESPHYEILDERGPEHDKEFESRVMWCGRELGRGTGGSKKMAEIAAAGAALDQKRWLAGPAAT